MYVSTRDLIVDDDEDGEIAKCGGRARRRVMPFWGGQHVRVALTIDTTLVLPVLLLRWLRFVTDGSFDVLLSTMVVAVSEGAVVRGLCLK